MKAYIERPISEIWKPVPFFEKKFEVNNLGTCVRNITTKRILAPFKDHTGYIRYSLYDKGFTKSMSMHRIVALLFCENKHEKPYVNHIDGNKLNNHCLNLEWCTGSENIKHAIRIGKFAIGDKRTQAKISDNQVVEIFLHKGRVTQIAREYNVSTALVSSIRSGKQRSEITSKIKTTINND